MVLPDGQDGVNDMFWPAPWNFSSYSDACAAQYSGVRPEAMWLITQYGGERLDGATKIVYSNGLLDPWSGGGVLKNVSEARDVVAVLIPEGAHHLDLRAATSYDPESVKAARAFHEHYISKWIDEWNGEGKLVGL